MLREYPSTSQNDLAPEAVSRYEGKEKDLNRLDLDEDLFSNLESAASKLPKWDGKLYKAQLEQVRRYVFEDAERLLNMLVPKPDTSRVKVLEKGHIGLESIADLGLRLKEAGMEVPWINPQWETVIDQIRWREIDEPMKISPFRNTQDERILELITRHDALQIALTKSPKLTDEQAESVRHIRQEFKDLPAEYKSELTRLITDDEFYHQSLAILKAQEKKPAEEIFH